MEPGPVAARVSPMERIRRTPPWVLDALLTVVMLVTGIGAVVTSEGGDPEGLREPDALAVVLMVGIAVPYFVRRRWPLPVYLVSGSFMVAMLLLDYLSDGGAFSMLVGTYTIGAYCERRERIVGVVFLAFVFSLLLLTDVPGLDFGGILFNAAIFTAAYLFGSNVRTRRLYTEQVEARAALLERERDEKAKRAVADERLRIAQELHDVVAHSMGVIAVQAGVGAHVIDSEPAEARKALDAIAETSRSTLGEIRRMLGVLREDEGAQYAPAPGLAELDRLLGDVRAAGVEVDLSFEGRPDAVPPGVELTAYRIVQEALTNVLKHAGPARAEVRIGCAPSCLELEVSDDGRGINGAAEPGGHGLLGMRERVAVYGGRFDAGPKPGGGFRVRATLPYGEPG